MSAKKNPAPKLPSKKSMHLPEYQPVLRDLYKRLIHSIQLRDQWLPDSPDDSTDAERIAYAAKYQAQAEALLELLESVTVFSTGGGFKKEFGFSFNTRVESFAFLL